jgi:uncharacterized protein (DUF952 family)
MIEKELAIVFDEGEGSAGEGRKLFKILRAEEWNVLEQSGRFEGSPDDLRDGFIHLSAREQLAGTLRKHFAGEEGLVLAIVAESSLGADLRWESSRGGAFFPHLYAALHLHQVTAAEPVASDHWARAPEPGTA